MSLWRRHVLSLYKRILRSGSAFFDPVCGEYVFWRARDVFRQACVPSRSAGLCAASPNLAPAAAAADRQEGATPPASAPRRGALLQAAHEAAVVLEGACKGELLHRQRLLREAYAVDGPLRAAVEQHLKRADRVPEPRPPRRAVPQPHEPGVSRAHWCVRACRPCS
jgi:hypothetical protein